MFTKADLGDLIVTETVLTKQINEAMQQTSELRNMRKKVKAWRKRLQKMMKDPEAVSGKKGGIRMGRSFRFKYKNMSLIQADLVRNVMMDAAIKTPYSKLLTQFDGRKIVDETKTSQRRLFVKVDEWETMTDDMKRRYYPEVFLSKDGVEFKVWNNWGRYRIRSGKIGTRARFLRGWTYKFIDAANQNGYPIRPEQTEPIAFAD